MLCRYEETYCDVKIHVASKVKDELNCYFEPCTIVGGYPGRLRYTCILTTNRKPYIGTILVHMVSECTQFEFKVKYNIYKNSTAYEDIYFR